ncbi:DmsC/YnfH family molybdoenzyme membrane anchor subunit [Rhodopirellula sp. MGV]|uniref:DmsC/YnfH family molybdoenzyme membrane anchor subunit n=1 Tax=Rhodopirellula sp. MGV TaxID=2023130 RepID=UPI000B960C61|nr:DmsC/YnfH family molybdoenzyme membrane anchor subunit [Rhodopirellula sp. MGV]OYP38216.1 molybdopterin oxidoreductase [Rhodopirellula sp. MGV]PNY38894.1 molybdopterin oxidoreductase [Rhodopirellula baltica]
MATALPVVNRQPDFLGQLLAEQQELTAVESFSEWHHSQDASTPAQEKYYRNLIPASAPKPGYQFAFEVDLDACSGCKACVVACHSLNGLEEDESWRRVGTLIIGDESAESPAAIQHVTTACHHCEDPGCLNGCPVKAYDKDPITGIVRHLDDQCIGCKYCTMMCPYEVPRYSDRLGIVRKCDMCHQRLSVGEAPACVQSCPNEAIRISVVPVGSELYHSDAVVPSAPPSSITQPTTRFVSSRSIHSSHAQPQDKNVDEVAESHWPLAIMLVMTQIAVGVLLAEAIVAGVLLVFGQPVSAKVTLTTALVAFAIANLGLGIAPLHLGQPLRMWRVFLGLRTSWLSREAVVLGKFMGAVAAGIGLLALPLVWDWIPEFAQAWIPIELIPSWLGRVVLLASLPLGALGLYCSAMIYIATKRQLWRQERTLPRFFGTGLAGGPLITAAVFGVFDFRWTAFALSLVAIGLLITKFGVERSTYFSESDSDDSYDRRSARLIRNHMSGLLQARIGLMTAAIVATALGALVAIASPIAGGGVLAIASSLFIAGENAERLLYFKSVVYDRMPGTL